MTSQELSTEISKEELARIITQEIVKVVSEIDEVLRTKISTSIPAHDYFPQQFSVVKPNVSPEDKAFAQKLALEMGGEIIEPVNVAGEEQPS